VPAAILATKLCIPPSRQRIVLRPRLVERLNEGLAAGHRLTLVSAPAGFGKTTLVSEWVAGCGRPVAWLSLDEGDSDPSRFLAYSSTTRRSSWPTIRPATSTPSGPWSSSA
jgi:LuxR family maltose regulon positive regulatory protein